MVVAAALFTFATILWVYFLWSRRKYYAFALKMPGPLGFPIIGIAHKFYNLADVLYEFPKYAYQYNVKTYFTWLGPNPMIYTMDPKIAEKIMNSPDTIDKSDFYDPINDIVGPGLLTSKGPTWHHHRKLINPSFSHKVLMNFMPLFNKEARIFSDNLETKIGCGEVNIKKLVSGLSLKIAVTTTFGLNYQVHEDSNIDFFKISDRMLVFITQRVYNPALNNSILFPTSSIYKPYMETKAALLEYLHNMVMERIKAFEKSDLDENSKANIFLDNVIKIHQHKEFTFDDIISEGTLMVFAAYETTATTMFTTLMLLAMHPHYQEKVFEEILTVFPDEDFEVEHENFKDLVYLEMIINETLRCLPSVPMIARNLSKDIPISTDVVVPKGTQMVIDMFNIHRDEEIWGPDAKKFNPDHFLPSNLEGKHSYSFLPFSKGPRNCIGWQYARIFLRIALVQVLRKYRFTTSFKFDDLRCEVHITLRYEVLPHLEVHRR